MKFFETRKPANERSDVELREYALDMLRFELDKGIVYAGHSDSDLERAARWAVISEALRPDAQQPIQDTIAA